MFWWISRFIAFILIKDNRGNGEVGNSWSVNQHISKRTIIIRSIETTRDLAPTQQYTLQKRHDGGGFQLRRSPFLPSIHHLLSLYVCCARPSAKISQWLFWEWGPYPRNYGKVFSYCCNESLLCYTFPSSIFRQTKLPNESVRVSKIWSVNLAFIRSSCDNKFNEFTSWPHCWYDSSYCLSIIG